MNKKEQFRWQYGKKRTGSITVQMLFLVSMLFVILYGYFFITFLENQQIKERLKHEKHLRLGFGALQWAKKYVGENFTVLKKHTSIHLSSYANLLGPEYEVIIQFEPEKNKMIVFIKVLFKKNKVFSVQIEAQKNKKSNNVEYYNCQISA